VSLSLFSISLYFFFWHMKNFRERLMTHEWNFYFGGWKTCFYVTLSVRVCILFVVICES
jgi:hypothetical protein